MKWIATLCFALALLAAGNADADGRSRWNQGNHWKKWEKWERKSARTQPGPAIPEPTGALLFGAGVVATMALTRRSKAR